MLACGDLFQLPPVVKDDESIIIDEKYQSVYFFSSESYREIKSPSLFELTYSFRQNDDAEFYSLLNDIRLGINLEVAIDKINRTCHHSELNTESSLIITTRRYQAEKINEDMLNLIEGPATSAKSVEFGEINENYLPAPRILRIKEGAKVMFVKNDSEGRWVNGTIGVITNCSDKNKKLITVNIGKLTVKVKRE